ncbi:GH32 C-terminal domain-containing protein, partial [Roseomonas elaeocarpi]
MAETIDLKSAPLATSLDAVPALFGHDGSQPVRVPPALLKPDLSAFARTDAVATAIGEAVAPLATREQLAEKADAEATAQALADKADAQTTADALATKASFLRGLAQLTGSRGITADDLGRRLLYASTSDAAITLSAQAAGFEFSVSQRGAGAVGFVAGSGQTIEALGEPRTSGVGATVTALHVGGGAWVLSGSVAPALTLVSYSVAALRALITSAVFTRASGATGYDATGKLVTVAADTPAYTVAGALVMEGAHTNLLRNSRFEGAVAGSPGTLPTNVTLSGAASFTTTVVGVAPDANGNPTFSIRFVGTPTAVTSLGLLLDTVTGIPAAQDQTLTGAVLASVTGTTPPANPLARMRLVERTASAAGSSIESVGRAITSAPSEYRMTYTMRDAATVAMAPYFFVTVAANEAVDFVMNLALPRVTRDAYSRVPTLPPVGAPAATSRAEDGAGIPLSSFDAVAPVQGALIFDLVLTEVMITDRSILRLDDGTANNSIEVYTPPYGMAPQLRVTRNGTVSHGPSTGFMVQGVAARLGLLWRSGMMGLCLNGGPVSWLSTPSPSSLNTLRLRPFNGTFGLSRLYTPAPATADFQAACAGAPGTALPNQIAAAGGSQGPGTGTPLSADLARQRWHFVARRGYLNDPCGVRTINGVHHLYYQWNPVAGVGAGDSADIGGRTTWGHATSTDLVHWTHQPIAIAPTPGAIDRNGAWSGCADTADDGTLLSYYTTPSPEQQMVATSTDGGYTWTKRLTPVLPRATLTADGTTGTARDPHTFRLNGVRSMILASTDATSACIKLYQTSNGNGIDGWAAVGVFFRLPSTDARYKFVWECPDLFEIGGKWVLVWGSGGLFYWFIGTITNGVFTSEAEGRVFSGSAYAGRSFLHSDGNRYLWAWPKEVITIDQMRARGWSGCMTQPVLLTLSNGNRLDVASAAFKNTLYGPVTTATPAQLVDNAALLSVPEPSLGVKATAAAGGKATVTVTNGKGEAFATVSYDPASAADRKLRINTGSTGTPYWYRDAEIGSEPVALEVFLDGSLIEVFLNGRIAHSGRAAPDAVGPFTVVLTNGSGLTGAQAWEML